VKIWILQTCVPKDHYPCFPQIFLDETLAEDVAERAILDEWAVWTDPDDPPPPLDYEATKRRARPVVDWRKAQDLIIQMDDEMRYGAWEITTHGL
jgi:hypothetical protein